MNIMFFMLDWSHCSSISLHIDRTHAVPFSFLGLAQIAQMFFRSRRQSRKSSSIIPPSNNIPFSFNSFEKRCRYGGGVLPRPLQDLVLNPLSSHSPEPSDVHRSSRPPGKTAAAVSRSRSLSFRGSFGLLGNISGLRLQKYQMDQR